MRKAMELIGFSLLTGFLMACYLLIPGMFKFVFSLGSLYIGFQYFKRTETWPPRVGFIALTVVLALLFTVIYTALALMYGWYINPAYKDGI